MSFPNEPTTANRLVDPELLRKSRKSSSMHPTMPAPDPSRGVAAEVDARRSRNHDPRSEE